MYAVYFVDDEADCTCGWGLRNVTISIFISNITDIEITFIVNVPAYKFMKSDNCIRTQCYFSQNNYLTKTHKYDRYDDLSVLIRNDELASPLNKLWCGPEFHFVVWQLMWCPVWWWLSSSFVIGLHNYAVIDCWWVFLVNVACDRDSLYVDGYSS